jgi:hypothetical protein
MLRNLFQQKIAHEGDVYYESWENRKWFDVLAGALILTTILFLGILYAIALQPK